jgi:hypothetical protein
MDFEGRAMEAADRQRAEDEHQRQLERRRDSAREQDILTAVWPELRKWCEGVGLDTWPGSLSYDFSWRKDLASDMDRRTLTCSLTWKVSGHTFAGKIWRLYENSFYVSDESRWLRFISGADSTDRLLVEVHPYGNTSGRGYRANSLEQIGEALRSAQGDE